MRAYSLFTAALELFHLSKFYLNGNTPFLKEWFSHFNCSLGIILAFAKISLVLARPPGGSAKNI